MKRKRLLVLLGPTAVGKTELSLRLADAFRCEIISGDSMQVYRGMDIGTAKLPYADRAGIPHHMMDIIEPTESFSASEFQLRTAEKIDEITARSNLPFVVGGTGLYIESLCYGYSFSHTDSDPVFRKQLENWVDIHGNEALHNKLQSIDPEAATRIHANDRRRLLRALEVHHVSGLTMSEQLREQTKAPVYDLCIIGLQRERAELYDRINERVDSMMEQGLVKEVQALLEKGCTTEMISMQALGYKELLLHLNGQLSLDEAVSLIKQKTRHFAKRQISWFRHMKDIHWIDLSRTTKFEEHFYEISDIINKTFISV